MEVNIDRVFKYLSWDKNDEIQAYGIELAKRIKNISVLIMPIESKSIWENCAKVIVCKSDDELKIYLYRLFEWLQDMNWPGADIIYDRLIHVEIDDIINICQYCLLMAKQTNDSAWERSLNDFYLEYNSKKITNKD